MIPPWQTLLPLIEQSISYCSDSERSWPVARKYAPSTEPVVENAQQPPQ